MWQPITTAPQTTPILGAWRDEDGWHFAEISYQKGAWVEAEVKVDADDLNATPVSRATWQTVHDTPEACRPTLWAPLPVGP